MPAPTNWACQWSKTLSWRKAFPTPTIDGKWVKDPAAFQPDIFWTGPRDHLIDYAEALGLKNVQDEGMGEFYIERIQGGEGGRDPTSWSDIGLAVFLTSGAGRCAGPIQVHVRRPELALGMD